MEKSKLDDWYGLYDFTESLSSVKIDPDDVKEVLKAWGNGSPGSEWSGGFVLKLKDGRLAYIEGWCDYTGWGCQDGAEVRYGKTLKELELPDQDMEAKPYDLNVWIKNPKRKGAYEL